CFAPFVNNHPEIKSIIVPHDISEERINACLKTFPSAVRFSQVKDTIANTNAHILIIDNIGMLNKLYRYATVTYIGGAWGTKGIHNILEAAVFGKPVFYGPNFSKNYEAQELVDAGGAFTSDNPNTLCQKIETIFANPDELEKSSKAAQTFVQNRIGATDIIMHYIDTQL
ncbi:MAG: 3-deoxy-D-manno-octulosonic acid transferase, partial [Pseudopedobacter saltans]